MKKIILAYGGLVRFPRWARELRAQTNKKQIVPLKPGVEVDIWGWKMIGAWGREESTISTLHFDRRQRGTPNFENLYVP